MVISLSGAADSSWGAVDYNEVPLVAMLPGQPQREAKAEQARALLAVTEVGQNVGMRVPVYFSELAVGLRLALFGERDELTQAMCRHNRHLHVAGVKGAIETGQ